MTIDGLLYLYKMSSDDILRSQVLKILSHQNKERLGLLWREILRHPSTSSTADKNTAIFGLESIEMSRKE
ncbi:hypothetical protein C6497_09520 [Candidatus Poribacteria bacterium]|nr:MAG: hypothetical protein C6497_09520 [Candidatus Poribacteria bacterium]